MEKQTAKELSFEQKLERLKEITGKLESGQVTLDEAIRNFEEGIKLSKDCHQTLNEAEKKVEILLKENGDVIGKKEMQ